MNRPQFSPLVEAEQYCPWPIAQTQAPTAPAPRILLIDDDPIFCRTMAKLAQSHGIGMTTCQKFQDLFSHQTDGEFDVLIVDYLFGEFTATQVLNLMKQTKPVILVSQMEAADVLREHGSVPITNFLPKSRGNEAILEAAMEALNAEFLRHWFDFGNPSYAINVSKESFFEIALGAILLVLLTCLGFFAFYSDSPDSLKPGIRWDQRETDPGWTYSGVQPSLKDGEG